MSLKETLKFVKLNESAVRILLVFVAIVFLGEIFIKVAEDKNPNATFQTIGDEKSETTHIVKKGENLWSIAVQYFGNGFKWKEIAQENGIDNGNQLNEGQKIVIPTLTDSIHTVTSNGDLPTPSDLNNPENTSSTSTEAKTYTVNAGDTLWSIAESQYGSGYNWVDIASANSLTNVSLIKEGQTLFLPNVNPKTPTFTSKDEDFEKPIYGESYEVQKGDNLWDIAVRAYGDGYKWTEIAKANDLQNPGLILPNQTLLIPR